MIKTTVTEEKEVIVELLKNRYKSDKDFGRVIDEVSFYYGRKIMRFAAETVDQRFVEDKILEVVSDQFFLGYFLMDQIFKDPEFVLEDSYWSLANGYVRNGIYPMLEGMMEGNDVQWQQSAAEKNFTKRVVSNFYDAYGIMVQLRKDVLALGAYYAFIENPNYKGAEQPEHNLRLANPFDLTFINPQVFMQPKYATENVEKWGLFQAETIKGGQWVGEIQLERRANPQAENENYLEIKISNILEQNDITDIINKMILKIPAEEHSFTSIQYYLVSDKKDFVLNNGKGGIQ